MFANKLKDSQWKVWKNYEDDESREGEGFTQEASLVSISTYTNAYKS